MPSAPYVARAVFPLGGGGTTTAPARGDGAAARRRARGPGVSGVGRATRRTRLGSGRAATIGGGPSLRARLLKGCGPFSPERGGSSETRDGSLGAGGRATPTGGRRPTLPGCGGARCRTVGARATLPLGGVATRTTEVTSGLADSVIGHEASRSCAKGEGKIRAMTYSDMPSQAGSLYRKRPVA